MDIMEIIKGRRSIRKFKQRRVNRKILDDLVEGARLAPSAANVQPLRYIIVDDPSYADDVFESLTWAGYLSPEGTPKEGEKPTAYIVVLETGKGGSNTHRDAGAAIQNILLGAWSYGVASCWIGAIDREDLANTLDLPKDIKINAVVALGYPDEEAKVVDVAKNGSIKYYKDEDWVTHVPKRKLEDILSYNEYKGKA